MAASSSKQTIVFLTGATSGIGRHAALYLAKKGCKVIGVGRNKVALGALKKDGEAYGIDAFVMDVNDEASIDAAKDKVDKLTDGYGVDVLINNAGYGQPGAILDLPTDKLRAQFETNVFGLVAVTQAFVPAMVERRSGRIINLSSVSGRTSSPFVGAYHASKHAVETISDSLRVEMKPFNVKVALIEPGPIKANFAAVSFGNLDEVAKDDESLYGDVYAMARERKEATHKLAASPAYTSQAIAHAAMARRPQLRYVVPGFMNAVVWPAKVIPARWVDALVNKAIGMTPSKAKQLRERLAARHDESKS